MKHQYPSMFCSPNKLLSFDEEASRLLIFIVQMLFIR